jgi:molybdate-binding protein
MEAGNWQPSLPVAIRMGSALGRSVEALFSDGDPPELLPATALAEPSGPSGRAQLVEVFGRLVAVPQEGPLAAVPGFGPSDCQIQARDSVLGRRSRSSDLLVAGCDPALPLLAEALRASGSQRRLTWWPCGSARAAQLLQDQLVHCAAIHHPTGERWEAPGHTAIGFARWREGLVSRPGEEVVEIAAAARQGLRIANREPGSEARQLLDQTIGGLAPGEIPGYQSQYRGHLPVATAVADRGADYGVATEAAGLASGLSFVELTEEDSLILLPTDRAGSQEVADLLAALAHRSLAEQLGSIPGYSTAILGEEM